MAYNVSQKLQDNLDAIRIALDYQNGRPLTAEDVASLKKYAGFGGIKAVLYLKTAAEMYGAKGYVAHHNTDIWRSTGMVDGATWGIWPNGAGWLSTHLWQRYLFNGDKGYLENVYPQLKGAADFYLTAMVKHPKYGWMVT